MTGVVSWLLVLEEDVGGDDTVDVAGADDDSDDDTALVDAFDVVATPGESVGTVCGRWSAMWSGLSPNLLQLTQLGRCQ